MIGIGLARPQAFGLLAVSALAMVAFFSWRAGVQVARATAEVNIAYDKGFAAGQIAADVEHNAAVQAIRQDHEAAITRQRIADRRAFAAAAQTARSETERWRRAYEREIEQSADFAGCVPVAMPRSLRICPGNPGCGSAHTDAGGNS